MAKANVDDRYDRFKQLWGDYGLVEKDVKDLVPYLKVTVPGWINSDKIPLNFEGMDVVVKTDPTEQINSLIYRKSETPKEADILVDEPINIFARQERVSVINEVLKEGEFDRIAKLYPKLEQQANIKAIQVACIDTIIMNLISFVAAGGNYDSYKDALNTRLKRYETNQ